MSETADVSGFGKVGSPYGALAEMYDALVAYPVFPLLLGAYARIVAEHDIVPQRIADLGCGTGNFVRYLARKGVRCFGVDRSAEMLRIAKHKSAGLPVVWLRQDLRAFSLPERVDMITCQFQTMNYCLKPEQLRQVFARCHTALDEDGFILFDFITGEGAQPIRQRRRLSRGDWQSLWVTRTCPGRRISEVNITLRRADGSGQPVSEVHRQRWYPLQTIRAALDETGFDPVMCFDMEKLRAADDASYWVQMLARRRRADSGDAHGA